MRKGIRKFLPRQNKYSLSENTRLRATDQHINNDHKASGIDKFCGL